jgi:RNA polymerase sigma factor (sigma-70 family)
LKRLEEGAAGTVALDSREALEQLYRTGRGPILGFVLRMTNDEEAARDVVQEAFAIALGKIESFKGESSLQTWVMAIAKNLCLKRRSRERERSFGDIEAIVDAHAEEPGAHSEIERSYYIEAVKNGCLVGLLQCLSFDQRCAFVLHILGSLPVATVARIMERSENSVRILVSRAKTALRAFLCRNCSLIGVKGRCSCDRMIGFSLSRGLIERYDPARSVPEVVGELRRFSDEVELYRSLPEPAETIAALVSKGDFKIFVK